MKILFFLIVATLMLTTPAYSTQWSRYITSKNHDDITVSFRQMKQNNAWTVQWRVQNKSLDDVETILKKRVYTCKDKTTTALKEETLGYFMAKSEQTSLLEDQKICPNSQIKLVEIETEIHSKNEAN